MREVVDPEGSAPASHMKNPSSSSSKPPVGNAAKLAVVTKRKIPPSSSSLSVSTGDQLSLEKSSPFSSVSSTIITPLAKKFKHSRTEQPSDEEDRFSTSFDGGGNATSDEDALVVESSSDHEEDAGGDDDANSQSGTATPSANAAVNASSASSSSAVVPLASDIIAQNIKLGNIQDHRDLFFHVRGTPSRYRILKEERFLSWLPLVLITALQEHEFPIVQYLLDKIRLEPNDPVYVRVAAEAGFDMGIRHLLTRKAPVDQWALVLASGRGHANTVRYMLDKKSPVCSEALLYAVESGHIGVVKVLLERKLVPVDDHVWRMTVRRGNLQLMRLLMMEVGMPQLSSGLLEIAAEEGHLEILDFLVKKGTPITTTAIALASQNGKSPVVSYLLDKGCPMDCFAVPMAILNNQKEVVAMLLKSKRAPLDKRSIIAADIIKNYALRDLLSLLTKKQLEALNALQLQQQIQLQQQQQQQQNMNEFSVVDDDKASFCNINNNLVPSSSSAVATDSSNAGAGGGDNSSKISPDAYLKSSPSMESSSQ